MWLTSRVIVVLTVYVHVPVNCNTYYIFRVICTNSKTKIGDLTCGNFTTGVCIHNFTFNVDLLHHYPGM